jgi:hypothetical protein
MNVLAIDPGPVESAWILWDGTKENGHGKDENSRLLRSLRENRLVDPGGSIVIEQIASYGMAVGAEVFETVFWSGRFAEAAEMRYCIVERMPRREVKLHICGNARAKDSNIRQALIDRFGGKAAAIGLKASQGPLYRVKADVWQALALAITWLDQHSMPKAEAV